MDIPGWLAENINKSCPCCGHPIANNDAPTDRYYSNERYLEHMAQRIMVLAKRTGVENLGIAPTYEAVRSHKLQLHVQILPHRFKEKPSLYLHEVEEICLIKGHQVKWRQYCEGCDTIMQVMKCPRTPPEIRKHAMLFICTAAVCNTKSRLLGKYLNVMLSESLDGYRSRSDFATEMDRKYSDVIQMVDVGKRKTGTAFLVKEIYVTDHEKSAIANTVGVPTITPEGLDKKLVTYRSYITEGRKGN